MLTVYGAYYIWVISNGPCLIHRKKDRNKKTGQKQSGVILCQY